MPTRITVSQQFLETTLIDEILQESEILEIVVVFDTSELILILQCYDWSSLCELVLIDDGQHFVEVLLHCLQMSLIVGPESHVRVLQKPRGIASEFPFTTDVWPNSVVDKQIRFFGSLQEVSQVAVTGLEVEVTLLLFVYVPW